MEKFVSSVPLWLRHAESDAEVAYISRTADCLVMSRELILCCVIWLQDSNTYTLAVGLKMLGLWVSKYGVKALLDFDDTRLLQFALEAVGRMHLDATANDMHCLLLVSFLTSVQMSPEGSAFLEALDDTTTAGLLKTATMLLSNADADVSTQIATLFRARWIKWVSKLVDWSDAEHEEPAKPQGWMSWFGAKGEEPASKVVSNAEAAGILTALVQAGLMALVTHDGETRCVGIEILYLATTENPRHLKVLDEDSEHVKKGLRVLVEMVASPATAGDPRLHAISILKLLTGLPNGRYNLANRLTEGYGGQLLRGLERLVRTEKESELAELAEKVLSNLTSSGDASWQIWMGGGSTHSKPMLNSGGTNLQMVPAMEDHGLPQLFRGSAPR
jgi:hypothetical protein